MSARFLIVNADDFNLTDNVSRAILKTHDLGIVTSTSVFTNLPFSSFQIKSLKSRKKLGIGLHLNATLGKPVSKLTSVRSLSDSSGNFKRTNGINVGSRHAAALRTEFQAQMDVFCALFHRLPDHLNTHHHIHADPKIFEAVARIAMKYKIPLRRVHPMRLRTRRAASLLTTNYFFGNLSSEKYWTEESLRTILQNLPEGTSEIMCHPGYVDLKLKKISSFTAGRAEETKLFSKPLLKELIRKEKIELIPHLRYNTNL